MRRPFQISLAVLALPVSLLARQTFSEKATRPTAARVPVVVELFTSEGCSSCPAADQVLLDLERTQPVAGVEVVALSEHVDYWNHLGWQDPFSAAAFTQRQRQYAATFGSGTYTPQAVVNGQRELVGHQRVQLVQTLTQLAQAPRASVQLTGNRTAEKLALRVQVAQVPTGEPAAVLLALTETGLSSQVGRGENGGRLLHHPAVVRELRALGTVGPDGTFAATPTVAVSKQWKSENLRAVVFVQQQASRHIVGVATLPVLSQ